MNNSCLSGVEGIWQGDLVSVSAILDLRTLPRPWIGDQTDSTCQIELETDHGRFLVYG